MRHLIVVLPAFILISCVAVDQNGDRVAENDVRKPKQGRLERVHESVSARIEQMKFQHGKILLRTLQQLISVKELAYVPIVKAMPDADERTRANLIYVLGFMEGHTDAHRVLAGHLKDKSEVVRFESAAALMNLGDWSAVPILIGFMDSGSRRLRYKSHEVLRDSTRQDFGFDFDAEGNSRAPALAKWKAWWEDRREEIIYQGRSN